ncbi:unnamed protein product [Pleuronectes platessa]|uniref:Uncharacterized protein n=1 Tax=Pleuronectes platessa TaxID=8262 RepID=A0A9N7Z3S3_PLEPL|nr:unnamed protein product [Pleuronectes platessa]
MTCQAVPLQSQSMVSNHPDHDPPSRPERHTSPQSPSTATQHEPPPRSWSNARIRCQRDTGSATTTTISPHDKESATLGPPPRPSVRDQQTAIHGAATEALDLRTQCDAFRTADGHRPAAQEKRDQHQRRREAPPDEDLPPLVRRLRRHGEEGDCFLSRGTCPAIRARCGRTMDYDLWIVHQRSQWWIQYGGFYIVWAQHSGNGGSCVALSSDTGGGPGPRQRLMMDPNQRQWTMTVD